MGDRKKTVRFAPTLPDNLPTVITNLSSFLQHNTNEGASSLSQLKEIINEGGFHHLLSDELDILSPSVFDKTSGLLNSISQSRDSSDGFISECRKIGCELISLLVQQHGVRLLGKSTKLVLDTCIGIYRFDVSFRVQIAALRVIEAVALAEKKSRRHQDLWYFVENVMHPISQVLIKEYKQRRKKMGSTVQAATLIAVASLLNYYPELKSMHESLISDLSIFCFSTLQQQMTSQKPEVSLVEGTLTALDNALWRFPEEIFSYAPNVLGGNDAQTCLYTAVIIAAANNSDVSRTGPQKAALRLVIHHAPSLTAPIIKDLEHNFGALNTKEQKEGAKERLQSEGPLGILFDVALNNVNKDIQQLGGSALNSVVKNILVKTVLNKMSSTEAKASALVHLQIIQRDARKLMSQWRESLTEGKITNESDFRQATLGLHLLATASRGLAAGGHANEVFQDASDLVEIIDITEVLSISTASRFLPNLCDAIATLILNGSLFDESRRLVKSSICFSLPSLMSKLGGYQPVTYTRYRPKFAIAFCRLLEALTVTCGIKMHLEWQRRCRNECERSISSLLLVTLFGSAESPRETMLAMRMFWRQVFRALNSWAYQPAEIKLVEVTTKSKKRSRTEPLLEFETISEVYSSDQETDEDEEEAEGSKGGRKNLSDSDEVEDDVTVEMTEDMISPRSHESDSRWSLRNPKSRGVAMETLEWLSNVFLRSCHQLFVMTVINKKSLEKRQHRVVEQFTGSTLKPADSLFGTTELEGFEDLAAHLAPLLLDSATTLQESLSNAEAVDRLASILGYVSPFLLQPTVAKWFCRFTESALQVLRSESPLPSLFSFIRVLAKQAKPALDIPLSPVASEDEQEIKRSPKNKRVRCTLNERGNIQIDTREANMKEAKRPLGVVLLSDVCCEIERRFLQWTDELLFNALELVLSVPEICVTIDLRVKAVRLSLEHGISHPPLAFAAIKILEGWQRDGTFETYALLSSIFPSLAPYLMFREYKADAVETDKAKFKLKVRIERERTQQLGLKNRSFAEPKLLQEMQLRVLRILGGSSSSIFESFDSSTGYNSQSTVKSRPPELDSELRLDFTVQNIYSTFQLGDIAERVSWLSENGANRQIQVSAMEAFHGIIHLLMGNLSTSSSSEQLSRRLSVLNRYLDVLLRLSSGADPVGQQLFDPLMFSIIDWISKAQNHNSEADIVPQILPGFLLAMSSPTDGKLRDTAGRLFAQLIKNFIEFELESSNGQSCGLSQLLEPNNTIAVLSPIQSNPLTKPSILKQLLDQLLDSIGHPNFNRSRSTMTVATLLIPSLAKTPSDLLALILRLLPRLVMASSTEIAKVTSNFGVVVPTTSTSSSITTSIEILSDFVFHTLLLISVDALLQLLQRLYRIHKENEQLTKLQRLPKSTLDDFDNLFEVLWKCTVRTSNELIAQQLTARWTLKRILTIQFETEAELSYVLGLDVYRTGKELIKNFLSCQSLSCDTTASQSNESFLWLLHFTDLWSSAVPVYLSLCLSKQNHIPLELLDTLTKTNNINVASLLKDFKAYEAVLLHLANVFLLSSNDNEEEILTIDKNQEISASTIIELIEFGVLQYGQHCISSFWNQWIANRPSTSSFLPSYVNWIDSTPFTVLQSLRVNGSEILAVLRSVELIIAYKGELHMKDVYAFEKKKCQIDCLTQLITKLLDYTQFKEALDIDITECEKTAIMRLCCMWFKFIIDSRERGINKTLLCDVFWKLLDRVSEEPLNSRKVEMFCHCCIPTRRSCDEQIKVSHELYENLVSNKTASLDAVCSQMSRLSELILFFCQGETQHKYEVQKETRSSILISFLLPLLLHLIAQSSTPTAVQLSPRTSSPTTSTISQDESNRITGLRLAIAAVEAISLDGELTDYVLTVISASKKIFRDLAEITRLLLSLSQPIEIHELLLTSLCPTIHRFYLYAVINYFDNAQLIDDIKQHAINVYDTIAYQLLANYFPIKSSDISRSSQAFENYKIILNGLCNGAVYSNIIPNQSVSNKDETEFSCQKFLRDWLPESSTLSPQFLWYLLIPSLMENGHLLENTILCPTVKRLIAVFSSDSRVARIMLSVLLSLLLHHEPNHQHQGLRVISSNHLQLDLSRIHCLTEKITFPLLWSCKVHDLIAVFILFWPAISSALAVASGPHLGLSTTSITLTSEALTKSTIELTLVLGILEILFTRIPSDAFKSTIAPKLLGLPESHDDVSRAGAKVIRSILGQARTLKAFDDDRVPEDQLRRFHLRLLGCLIAIIGSSQDNIRIYTDILFARIPWALLVPSYSLESFPKQQPFSIDTDFSKFSRPPISLQRSLGKKKQFSAPSLGERGFDVDSGARELSLKETTMLSSSLSVNTLSNFGKARINPITTATRKQALGTLKAVIATQLGAALVKQSQISLSQATLGLSEKPATALSESQISFESLLTEMTESVSVDTTINAELWDGWQIAGQAQLMVQTKRIQGALLGRMNRILGATAETKADAVVMWDVEWLENDFINQWPIVPILLKLIDILNERFLLNSNQQTAQTCSDVLLRLFDNLVPPLTDRSSIILHTEKSSALRLLGLRLITLRWKFFARQSKELLPRVVCACLSDPAITTKTFHYFLRDICEVLISWNYQLEPNDTLISIACSKFIHHLIRVIANPKMYWLRVHVDITQRLLRTWLGRSENQQSELKDLQRPLPLQLDIPAIMIPKLLLVPIPEKSTTGSSEAPLAFRIAGIEISRVLANVGVDPAGFPSLSYSGTELERELRTTAETFYRGIVDNLSVDRASIAYPAAETSGLILSRFPNELLEVLIQKQLLNLLKRDVSKGFSRSEFRGTQFHDVKGVQCLRRVVKQCPWILVGPSGSLSRQLFNSFLTTLAQSSTPGTGSYDPERRVHLLEVVATILSLRQIEIKKHEQLSLNDTEQSQLWLEEQQRQILQILLPLWDSLFHSIDADVYRPTASAFRHAIELCGVEQLQTHLRRLTELVKDPSTMGLFKEAFFDISLWLLENVEGFQRSPDILHFLFMENLDVPSSKETTEKLLKKRQEFFETHCAKETGLCKHPNSSLLQFFLLLFPAYLNRLDSQSFKQPESFIHTALVFLLDFLKNSVNYQVPLFTAFSEVSKASVPIPVETSLHPSNITVRSTFKQTSAITLFGIAADVTSRIDATLGGQLLGSMNGAVCTFSTQHPFLQALSRPSSLGPSSELQKDENKPKFLRYSAKTHSAQDKAIESAEWRKKEAHREYEKASDFRHKTVDIVRSYHHGSIPDPHLSPSDIFNPLSQLIVKDEELALHVMLSFIRAYFGSPTTTFRDVAQLQQVLINCLQSTTSLSSIFKFDALLIRLCFSLPLVVPMSLPKALTTQPGLDLPPAWNITAFNYFNLSSTIMTITPVIVTSALQSNEWFGGVYILECLLQLWKKSKGIVESHKVSLKPLSDFESSILDDVLMDKGETLPIEDEIKANRNFEECSSSLEQSDVESILLSSLYRLLRLLESEWSLEGLIQFFPNSIIEVWEAFSVSRRKGLQKIDHVTSQKSPTSGTLTGEMSLNASWFELSEETVYSSLLKDMKLEALQALCKWPDVSTLLDGALSADKWESMECQLAVRAAYHRHMETEDINDGEKLILTAISKQLLSHETTRTSRFEEENDEKWDLEAWTQTQSNPASSIYKTAHLRAEAVGVIAASTLCVMEDSQRAKLLCLEGYRNILSQLRRIPPLAIEAKQAIIGTIPLLREVETLADSRIKGWKDNAKQMASKIPSVRHILCMINGVAKGGLFDEDRSDRDPLWHITEELPLQQSWSFTPITTFDLCTIRLRALIDFSQTCKTENSTFSQILADGIPSLYTHAALELIGSDEWESAEEILKYSLKWMQLPCIQKLAALGGEINLNNGQTGLNTSLNSFKAVVTIKTREACMKKSLSKLDQIRKLVERECSIHNNDGFLVQTECRLLRIRCMEVQHDLQGKPSEVTNEILTELYEILNGFTDLDVKNENYSFRVQKDNILLKLLQHLDEQLDHTEKNKEQSNERILELRKSFCETVIQILSQSIDYTSEAFKTAHIHLPRLFEFLLSLPCPTDFLIHIQKLPCWTLLRWMNQLLAWIARDVTESLSYLFSTPLKQLILEYPSLIYYPLLASFEANIFSASSCPGALFISSLLNECQSLTLLTAEFVKSIEMLINPVIKIKDFYLSPIHKLANHSLKIRASETSQRPKLKKNPNPFSHRIAPTSRQENPPSASSEVSWNKDIKRRWHDMWESCLLMRPPNRLLGREHQISSHKFLLFSETMGLQEMCEQSLKMILEKPDSIRLLINEINDVQKEIEMVSTTSTKSPTQDLCYWFEKFNGASRSYALTPDSKDKLVWPFISWESPSPPKLTAMRSILRFEPMMTTLQSKQRPRRLVVTLDDLTQASILVKGGDDLRLDQRITQMFELINQITKSSSKRYARSATIRTFGIVPIKAQLGLVAWVPESVSLKSLLEKELGSQITQYEAYKLFLQSLAVRHKDISEAYRRRLDANAIEVVEAFESSKNVLPSIDQGGPMTSIIRQWSPSIEIYTNLRKNFLKTLATFNAVSYIFGIGDRHPDNFLIDTHNFEMIGIDFGYSFEIGISALPIPELVPFRMTPSLLMVTQPLGGPLAKGEYGEALTSVFKVCRNSQRNISAVASVFIHEPLKDSAWLAEITSKQYCLGQITNDANNFSGNESTDKKSSGSTSIRLLSELSKLKLEGVQQKLNGANPGKLLLKALTSSEHHVSSIATDQSSNLYKAVIGAVTNRYRSTITQENELTPRQQGLVLTDMATDPNLLGRAWLGWSPFL